MEEVVQRLDPSYPVFCVWPDVIKAHALEFLEGFPGTVLYAVKCNPHPAVLQALYESGIRDFDTASLPEIAQVTELFDDVRCYFNHPVKGRGALDSANKVYGIGDYVVDHITELDKICRIAGTGVTIEVRVRTQGGHAVYNLSSKFGASREEAIDLLREVVARGCRPALAFHVGSQCADPDAFRAAMKLCAEILAEAGVAIDYLDVGGGFPARYQENVPPMAAYFKAISQAAEDFGLDMRLLCEPGRALVADGGALLAQVHLRRGDDLYINDGIYGCLSEIRDGDLDPPVRAIGRKRALAGADKAFRIFGPTCDSLDVLKIPFVLPDDIAEGDWIAVGMLGAYSLALASGFNGFITDTVVRIDGLREEVIAAAS